MNDLNTARIVSVNTTAPDKTRPILFYKPYEPDRLPVNGTIDWSRGLQVVMAYIVMAYIVMAYIFIAYIVMAYIVMARSRERHRRLVARASKEVHKHGGEVRGRI